MSFTWPLALVGLVLIPLLILLDRWRRRPRARVWPSLQLWRAVEGLDAPSRRRVQPLLLYECAAVLLLALAAAGPVVSGVEATEIIVLVDMGPHMQARRGDGTVLEATLAEVERIPGNKRRIDVDGDLVLAATSFDEPVVLATNRPGVEGKGYIVVGRAPDGYNVGIDAVEVTRDKVWFALATDGEPREVDVSVGEQHIRVRTGVGIETNVGAPILIHGIDNFDGDDGCDIRLAMIFVRHDSDSPFLETALQIGIFVGSATGDIEPDLVIETKGGDPVSGVVRGADCVVGPGLFDGLVLDGCAWSGARSRSGTGLLNYRGRALAKWLDERTLWLGLPLDRDWDEHGTLAVLLARAKRAALKFLPGDALVGIAIANPAPGFVDTRGVDRPWNGTIPKGRKTTTAESNLSWLLAALAVLILALYARAMLRA